MSSPEPPPVTIRVPGAPVAPADVLSHGRPPRERRRPPPRWARGAVAALAAAGLLAAVGILAPTQPPVERPAEQVMSSAQGVTATVGLAGRPLTSDPLVRLAVTVDVDESAVPRPLGLLGITGRGFWIQPVDVDLPLLLEPDATGAAFEIEVLVNDCGVEPSAPRRLDLAVQRTDLPAATLPVRSNPDVVRALDRLVARTCGRPRG